MISDLQTYGRKPKTDRFDAEALALACPS